MGLLLGHEEVDGLAIDGIAGLRSEAFEVFALATFAQLKPLQSPDNRGSLARRENRLAGPEKRQPAFAFGIVLEVGHPFLGGTGLGLAICKWIAEAHGGFIRAGNANGAEFTVSLPKRV